MDNANNDLLYFIVISEIMALNMSDNTKIGIEYKKKGAHTYTHGHISILSTPNQQLQ